MTRQNRMIAKVQVICRQEIFKKDPSGLASIRVERASGSGSAPACNSKVAGCFSGAAVLSGGVSLCEREGARLSDSLEFTGDDSKPFFVFARVPSDIVAGGCIELANGFDCVPAQASRRSRGQDDSEGKCAAGMSFPSSPVGRAGSRKPCKGDSLEIV